MSSSKPLQQDILAQNVSALIAGGKWTESEVTREDWHFAEDLLMDMGALEEPGAYERAAAGMERLAQQYERWLKWVGQRAA